jgi:hypothetical protein
VHGKVEDRLQELAIVAPRLAATGLCRVEHFNAEAGGKCNLRRGEPSVPPEALARMPITPDFHAGRQGRLRKPWR